MAAKTEGNGSPAKPEKKKMTALRAARIAFETVFYIFCLTIIVSVAIALIFGEKKGNGVMVGPFGLYALDTGSMSPTINEGGVVLVKRAEASAIKDGDIITFSPNNDGSLVTHRVRSVLIAEDGGYSYITRGDANRSDDPNPVPYGHVVGRVIFWLNGVGAFLRFIRTPSVIIAIACAVAVIIALSLIVSGLKKSKLKKRKAAEAAKAKISENEDFENFEI